MDKESPLEYYSRRAGEIGIDANSLHSKSGRLVTFIVDFPSKGVESIAQFVGVAELLSIRKGDHGPFSDMDIMYSSEENSTGLWLNAVHYVRVSIEDNKTMPGFRIKTPSAFLLCHEDYKGDEFFGLTKKNVVTIEVEDGLISKFEKHSRFELPHAQADIFKIGKDYKPALDWMLQQYAAGLRK